VPPLLRLAKVPDYETSARARQWLDRLSNDHDVGVSFSAQQALATLTRDFDQSIVPLGRPGAGAEPEAVIERLRDRKSRRSIFRQRLARDDDAKVSLHELGGRSSVLPPQGWPPQAEKLAPVDYQLARVGTRVPRSKHEVDELLVHRPGGWEFIYFGAVLHLKMVEIEPKWREHDMRYPTPSNRQVVPADREIVTIQEAMHELSGRLRIEELLSPEAQQRAFGAPGEPGNPILIEHMGLNLVEEFVGLLDWAARIRGAIVRDDYRRLYGIAATFPDLPLYQFRTFVDQSVRKFDRISMLIDAGIAVYLPLELTIEIDSRTVALHQKELKRLARRNR
jgi:hypothetical protein